MNMPTSITAHNPSDEMTPWKASTQLLLQLALATYAGNRLALAIVDEWHAYVTDYEATWGRNVPANDPYLFIIARRLRWGNLLELELDAR